jgi:hypothetical protein
VGQCDDATDLCLRESRDGAETVPNRPALDAKAFDITPGGRFVGLTDVERTESGAPMAPQIQLVLNWFEELRARLPSPK